MFALLVSFLFCIATQACEFTAKVKGVYSLAGSVTLALKDLDLIKNPKLKGVSTFHPVDKSTFKGAFLPGGIFLSHKTLSDLSGSVLFYDESRELSRILSRYKDIKKIEVKTRSLTPLQVTQTVEKLLSPYVVGCNLESLSTEIKRKLEILKNSKPQGHHMLFFLGKIQNERLPELLMVNDGIVKWMVQEKLVKTYPSNLGYVNWSSKIMQDLPKETLKIGIKDSGSENVTLVEKKANIVNLTFPGALIPGSGQVDAIIYLFKNL